MGENTKIEWTEATWNPVAGIDRFGLSNHRSDWIKAIDRARGTMSFGDFVRQAVRQNLSTRKLSEMPAWGQGRPRTKSLKTGRANG